MQRLRTYIEVVGVAVVLAFLCAIAVGVFVDLFWASDHKAPDAFRGGFIGAFFAFLFVRVGDLLTRVSDRVKKNVTALVVLQQRYMEIAGELQDNIYLLKTWDAMLRASSANGGVPFWTNRLQQVSIPRSEIVDLLNIDLVNELFSLNVQLRKINQSAESFCDAYETLRDAYVNQKISRENYMQEFAEMNDDRQKIAKHFQALVDTEILRALGAIRLLLRNKTLGQKLLEAVTVKHYPKGFPVQRENELSALRQEIASNVKVSRDKIDAIENA